MTAEREVYESSAIVAAREQYEDREMRATIDKLATLGARDEAFFVGHDGLHWFGYLVDRRGWPYGHKQVGSSIRNVLTLLGEAVR